MSALFGSFLLSLPTHLYFLPRFHYLNYPDYAEPELMNSWAQLLLGLSPFDGLLSLGFPLPQLQFLFLLALCML